MKSLVCRRRLKATAGFSLVEVLVTVALLGVVLTAIMGILRHQIRSMASLRSHSEARLYLEQAVDRFQYGDGAQSDSLIQGRFAEYRLSFAPVSDLDDARILPGTWTAEPDSAALSLLDDGEFHRRRASIRWTEHGRDQALAIEAWRFLPESEGQGGPGS